MPTFPDSPLAPTMTYRDLLAAMTDALRDVPADRLVEVLDSPVQVQLAGRTTTIQTVQVEDSDDLGPDEPDPAPSHLRIYPWLIDS
jgi:hypothetical protein